MKRYWLIFCTDIVGRLDGVLFSDSYISNIILHGTQYRTISAAFLVKCRLLGMSAPNFGEVNDDVALDDNSNSAENMATLWI